jgi:hypothetical protein
VCIISRVLILLSDSSSSRRVWSWLLLL